MGGMYYVVETLAMSPLKYSIFPWRSDVHDTHRGVPDLGMVKTEFYVPSDRVEAQLPNGFYLINKYCS